MKLLTGHPMRRVRMAQSRFVRSIRNLLKTGEKQMHNPNEILQCYRIGDSPLFAIGSFDTGVTVLSQQVRALNLVSALVESKCLSCETSANQKRIAIVGGGFAGLTFAAGLIKKGVRAKITIFEQRDTLMPLQQGSDSRWLHPHIYDWPADESEASVAMLPVLNWTAARASDVVVQILANWKAILEKFDPDFELFCNTRHIQIDQSQSNSEQLQIEWVGEKRQPDGTTDANAPAGSLGLAKDFDIVILAVGFGLEVGESYWRNETMGQPSLDQRRRTFLVSGQGDGAMIDLLRLRISQYRQDRILEELFQNRPTLLYAIKQLYASRDKIHLFNELESLGVNGSPYQNQFFELLKDMRHRLRRDTNAVLRLKVRKFSELFDSKNQRIKISFQNKLLVYFLYKCGGFSPTNVEEETLVKEHAIFKENIIRRHGPIQRLDRILSKDLFGEIARALKYYPEALRQSDEPQWLGGYFGYTGPLALMAGKDDKTRKTWRKEYLPGPTSLLGVSLCSAISAAILSIDPSLKDLRVTLHRTMKVTRDEELLQQTCDYQGTSEIKDVQYTAGRTFETDLATIGLAYQSRKIVRSRNGVTPEDLKSAMETLGLVTSRSMSEHISFVVAIPLLEPETNYTLNTPVAGVVYIDCKTPGYFMNDKELESIVLIAQRAIGALESRDTFERVKNQQLTKTGDTVLSQVPLPAKVAAQIELLDIEPPRTSIPFQFNYDCSNFSSIQPEELAS